MSRAGALRRTALIAAAAGAAFRASAFAAEVDNARAYCARENAHWVGGEQQCACNAGFVQSGNTCVSASAGSGMRGATGGGFAVPPSAFTNAAAGVIGGALGNALVSPLSNPYQGHVRPKPVVGDDDESTINPDIAGGVGAADDIIGGFIQSEEFTACLENPMVFCGGRTISLSDLEDQSIVAADEELSDAVAEPSASPAPKKKVDDKLARLSEYWRKFADAISTEDLFRQLAKAGGLIPEAAKKLSETAGSAATAVGIIDAGVTAKSGDNAKATGMATGLTIGIASEGSGLALSACGQVAPCGKATASGFDAVVSAPGKAGGGFWKAMPDQDMIQADMLAHDGEKTDDAARQRWNQQIDENAKKLNNSGQNVDFINGLTGAQQ